MASAVYDLLSSVSADGMDEFVTLFAYEGFNPEMVHEHFAKIRETQGIGSDEFVNDMRALITLGAMKGNYTLRNAGKISEEGRRKADALYKKYKLKQGSLGSDKKAVTLPRILSAFPELTTRVVLKAPVRDFGTQTGQLARIMKNPVFPSLVPKSMDGPAAQTLLYLYTVYSADQSIAISQVKDFGEAFAAQSQFVTIAFNSSVPAEATRKIMIKGRIEEIVAAVSALKTMTVGTPPAKRVDAAGMRTAINSL